MEPSASSPTTALPPPAIDIRADAARGTLRLTLAGMLTEGMLEGFERDLDAAHARAAALPGWVSWTRVLIDVRGARVQTRAAADRLRARMLRFQGHRRRIAFVATDAQLLRLQISRLADGEDHRFFDDAAAAERWMAAG